MPPKFLCCLPVRSGVFLISFFQFLVSGGLAGFLWTLWFDSESYNDENTNFTTITFATSVYTAVALVSFIGFIGTILQKSKFIKTYLIMHYIFLSFQICYLVALYITRNQSLDDCLDGTTSQGKIDYCNAIRVFKDYPKVYALSNIIVPRVIVIQLYACYLVRSYSLLLERQGFKKNRQFNRVPGQPVNHHDENYHKSAYPYRSRK